MTNKQRYKQAFSVLQTSKHFTFDVEKIMILNKKRTMKTITAVIAACFLLVVGLSTAYATNLGGIQRTIQLWIHGDQTDATITIHSDGSYRLSYLDENGEITESNGGGIAIKRDGSERALTTEEIIQHLNEPDVEYKEDGTVWVYYYDQKIDITDKFKNGVCYVKISNGDETIYMTIKYRHGWCTNPYKYISPSVFN